AGARHFRAGRFMPGAYISWAPLWEQDQHPSLRTTSASPDCRDGPCVAASSDARFVSGREPDIHILSVLRDPAGARRQAGPRCTAAPWGPPGVVLGFAGARGSTGLRERTFGLLLAAAALSDVPHSS